MGPFLCLTMLCGLLGQGPVVEADRPPPDQAQTFADGLLSLHRPALAAKLQLSADQNRAANKEIVRYQTELRGLYGNYPPGAQDAEGEQIRRRLRQQHIKLREATIQHLTELLTDPQREQLVGLSPLYADEEAPEQPAWQPAQDDRPACTIVKAGDAQLRQEIRGLTYVLQNDRAGALIPWNSHETAPAFRDLAIEVSGRGTHLVIGNRRQPEVFWHSADRVITSVAVSPDRTLLATGTGWFPDGSRARTHGEVRIWDMARGRLIHKQFFPDDVSVVGFRDERTVLVGVTPRGGR